MPARQTECTVKLLPFCVDPVQRARCMKDRLRPHPHHSLDRERSGLLGSAAADKLMLDGVQARAEGVIIGS